jgi:hypothetical protein
MDLRAEHNSRNVSSSAIPSFLASKSTNGPSRRPEKDIVRKVSGSKARVHGRRNPVQSDLTAQTYEHKRGRVRVRDKAKLERRRDELYNLRREELLRRMLEFKYIKDGVARKAEEDCIRLLEERVKGEWELRTEREMNEREKRIIEEDRASITRERDGYDDQVPIYDEPKTSRPRRASATASAQPTTPKKPAVVIAKPTSKATGGEAAQRGGVPLETSFGPHQALQYQAYLNTYQPSRDVRTLPVIQGSPPPPVNFRFAHYDPAPSRPAYKSQQQSVPSKIEQDENNGTPARDSVSHRESMDSSSISQQRVSSASRPTSPWTVPPTTTIKAQEGMHGTYKKERQKADRSRSNHNKSNKKGPFVLKYTISMDDTQNEVSRNRTQFMALGSVSQ